MSSHEALVRNAYAALSRGDGRCLAELVSPMCRWVITGDGPAAGEYEGPDGVASAARSTFRQTRGQERFELIEVVGNDRRTVVLGLVHCYDGERAWVARQLILFEFENHKIIEARVVLEESAAYDRFWSGTADSMLRVDTDINRQPPALELRRSTLDERHAR